MLIVIILAPILLVPIYWDNRRDFINNFSDNGWLCLKIESDICSRTELSSELIIRSSFAGDPNTDDRSRPWNIPDLSPGSLPVVQAQKVQEKE